jgi:hypothetical protein
VGKYDETIAWADRHHVAVTETDSILADAILCRRIVAYSRDESNSYASLLDCALHVSRKWPSVFALAFLLPLEQGFFGKNPKKFRPFLETLNSLSGETLPPLSEIEHSLPPRPKPRDKKKRSAYGGAQAVVFKKT